MSTSGGYVPTGAVECPYTPRMTRAAALALRTAGALLENCVVVITDGPTIGTAGNTSPTEIELNPVSPTELGVTARVHTAFAASAWQGMYDVDLGAAGTITELTDDFGNTAKDVDSGGATVHTQFPWHLGSASLRDNYLEDSTLTGWDTQVGPVSNNRVINATVNLTGKTGGVIVDTLFQGVGVVLGAGGGSASISRSQFHGVAPGTVTVNHTGTGTLSYADSRQRDGFLVAHSGTGGLTVTDSTLQNHGSAVADLAHAGGGTVAVNDSVLTSPGTANAVVDYQAGATGSVTIFRSALNGARLVKVAGGTGPVTITGSDVTDATITIGATNGASTNAFVNVITEGTIFNFLGPVASPGRNDMTAGAVFLGTSVTVAATATAGIGIQGGVYENATGVTQNRTGGTASTTLFACNMRGFSTFVDNGTTDPGVGTSFSRLDLVDSAITVGNLTGKTLTGTVVQQSSLMGSTLTLTGPNGTAFLNRVRLWGASLVNAGFDGSDLIIDGGGVGASKTMTATQSNRLFNQAFDNWV